MGFGVDTVHWVGGLGTKAGSSSAGGGVKKSIWDANPNLIAYMDENGAAKYSSSGTYNSGTGVITCDSVFPSEEDALKDWIVYVTGAGVNDGRYLIIASTQDTLTIGTGKGPGGVCTVYVGGAFDKLQNAIDNTDASNAGSNVTIYTNKSETNPVGTTLEISSGGSTIPFMTYKRIVGFGALVGDGQQVDIYSAMSQPAIKIDGVENVIVENLNGVVAGGNGWYILGSYSITLNNCWATNSTFNGFSVTNSTGCVFINCMANAGGNSGFSILDSGASMLIGCLAYGNGKWGFNLRDAVAVSCIACNNALFLSGYGGFKLGEAGKSAHVYGCVAYNNGNTSIDGGFILNGHGVSAINCIALSNTGYGFRYNSAGYPFVKHCCAYDNTINFNPSGIAGDNIETDPQFVDAANTDFRPRNPIVLRGGFPDINGNVTQIGAIIQAYQFPKRARMVNHGRMSIVR